MEQRSSGDLELQTAPQFMLMLYDHLNQSGEVLEEIGIRSTSPSQLACLVDLPLPSLFCCLQLFARWIKDGVYDFAALPFGVKTHLSFQDLQAVQQIPFKWTGRKNGGGCHQLLHDHLLSLHSGSRGDLLEEIKQMNEVLKHSEAHITKTANEATHVRTIVTQIIQSKSCSPFPLRNRSCSTFGRSTFLGQRTTFLTTSLPLFSSSIMSLSE